MKYITAAASIAALSVASAAYSGNLVFEAPVEQEVIEEEPIGGSRAGWLVPVLAIAIIAAAIVLSDDDDDDGSAGEENGFDPV